MKMPKLTGELVCDIYELTSEDGKNIQKLASKIEERYQLCFFFKFFICNFATSYGQLKPICYRNRILYQIATTVISA
ncbi:hypothetical protein H9I48_05490 [Wolbachia pipientis]|uniref:hypothetical protein n=1 Tax=Wolbachia pipientis TaxID=955 RepID=UPI001650E186|nr:hypothetical protein [Wolbachia pipientis]MBC6686644.1 hypothetical protein [Wolbachia pipientis]